MHQKLLVSPDWQDIVEVLVAMALIYTAQLILEYEDRSKPLSLGI